MFGNLFKNQNGADQGVYLGAPEAEAEALEASRVSILDVYEDYHGLASALTAEKFIITGRKGCGKSAFAEFVTIGAKFEPNLFSKFIRKNDFSLEEIVQKAKDKEMSFGASDLLRWVVFVHIISLFLTSEAAKESPKISLLREFIKKNSGYVEINKYDVIERIHKDGFSISIEPLRRYIRAMGKREVEVKSDKAPFFKMLPHLQEIVCDVLMGNVNRSNENKYVLFFDDLDVGYDSGSKASRDFIVELLRTAKYLNGEVFNGLGAKIVVLLRDDIEADLMASYGDTAKIFSSYSHKIVWYQDGYTQNLKEDDLNLKRFINKRIVYAYKKKGMPVNLSDIWSSLVSYDGNGKSTFKYIVNMTLFRPRDLLLFFQPLEKGLYYLPLSKGEVEKLARVYSVELAREIENELSFMFSSEEIAGIRQLLTVLSGESVEYNKAVELTSIYVQTRDPGLVLRHLYGRSLIGNRNDKGHFTFKCRQSSEIFQRDTIDSSQKVIIHRGILTHLKSLQSGDSAQR